MWACDTLFDWNFVLNTNLAIEMHNYGNLDVSLATFGRFSLENHVTPQTARTLRANKPVMVTLWQYGLYLATLVHAHDNSNHFKIWRYRDQVRVNHLGKL